MAHLPGDAVTAALVELVDGQLVASDSEAWRDECFARYLLRKPLEERRAWIVDHEAKHGADSAERLKATIRAVHEKARLTR